MTGKNKGLHSRQNLIDAISRADLYSFVQRIFPIVSPGSPFLPNWHVEAIAYALTRVMRGEIKRLIITVPPRSLKSICASVAFPAFVLGHDPTRRIICVSYSEGLARKHANDFRAVMRSPLYRRLFPGTRISAAKDTELEVMTTARGFRYATSVGGTLTGRGGNLLILDDPLSAQDAHSERARETLKQWYANTLLSRLDNKAEDAIIVVTQRLHVDDLVGHLLEAGRLDRAEPAGNCRNRTGRAARAREGSITAKLVSCCIPNENQPGRLEKLKRDNGLGRFCRAVSAAAGAARRQPHQVGLVLASMTSRRCGMWAITLIVSWDTAMSAGELSDYSACVVLHLKGEDAFILDVVRERLDYPDLRRKIIDLHRRWRNYTNSYALLIEDKGSGMSLIQDLKGEGIRAIPVKPTMDKVMRMNAHTARIEAGCVHLPRLASWLDDFRKELMAFPAGKYDDQVDALSQALDRAFINRGFMTCGPLRGLC